MFIALSLAVGLFASPARAAGNGRPDGLFRSPPVGTAGVAPLERGVLWQRRAEVDLSSLRTAPASGALDLAFNVGSENERRLWLREFDSTRAGRWIAKGDIEGVIGSRALFLERNGWLAGTVRVPGDGVYVIQGPAGGECLVRKLDPLQMPRCGLDADALKARTIERLQAEGRPVPEFEAPPRPDKEEALPKTEPSSDSGDIQPHDEPTVTVDMMVLYTAASRDGAGGREAVETLIELAVIEANDCFLNSLINLKLNLVHTREIAYSETGDMQEDLINVAFGLGGLAGVEDLRTLQFKTDLVCLITEREDSGFIAGIAYLLQSPSGDSTQPSYSVVRRAYAVGDYTFAHEVGHNLGCAHDRNNAGGPGAFNYSYGHRFNALGVTYATVMTYPPGVRIPYFSNPLVAYDGAPTGIPAGSANSANNAGTINQTGTPVSNYRTAVRRFDFAQPRIEVDEGVGLATITVRRVGTSTTGMMVSYATSNLGALAGQDYTATSGTLSIPAGQTEGTFTVPITNDTSAESPESFLITLADPKPSGFSGLGENYQIEVVINDNENGFHFELANAVRSEADGGLSLRILREGPGGAPVVVTLRPTAGTATAGGDFAGGDQVINFAAGDREKTATVSIVNDFVAEPDKAFTVALVNPTAGYAVTGPSVVSVTLLDDDRMGAHDVAFNNAAGPNDIVFASVVRPNGNVVIGGGFSQFDGMVRAGITELKADGASNPAFDPGIGVSGTVYAMALRPDGRLVIGGAFTAVNGVSRPNLAQLNADGSLDQSFDPGLGPDDTVRSLALTAGGKIFIGGFFLNYANQARSYIARVNTGGTLDTDFNPGSNLNGPVRAVAVLADDRVVIGGDFTAFGGTTRPYLARLNANGSLDGTFTPFMNNRVRALALMSDGDVLAGGEFSAANGFGYNHVARLNSNGTTDTAFDLAARPSGFVRAIALQDQQILIAGDFTSIAGQNYGRVARLNVNGSVDATFQPGAGANAIIYALAVDPGRFAIVGGEFSTFAGVPRPRVARVRITPNVETFDPVIVPLTRNDVTGGPITIRFEGRAGNRYALDGSGDLTGWTGVVTNTAPANDTSLTDPAPPNNRRYYRIRQVP